jgi:hypothetical protein
MKILLVLILFLLHTIPGLSQKQALQKVKVKKGRQVVLKDTTFITKRDTVLYLTKEQAGKIKVRENPRLKSNRFYDSLEEKASDNKVANEVFDFVVKKRGRKEKLVSAVVKSEDAFKPFTGYIIGSIVFKSVDLLEGSVVDTLQKATTNLGKFVNKVHTDTRAKIIKQNLLFSVGDLVDPYQLADNERVLRQFNTLRDARIFLKKNKKKGIVDVIVVTQDVASIGVSGDFSSIKNFRLDVYDINILGYARQLQVSYFRSTEFSPQNGYEITLREPNFRSTFIEGELQYANNYIRERTRLAVGRDFFAPEIKYAGGMEAYRTHENFYAEAYDTIKIPYTEKSLDLWVGRSFEFKKRMNLIFSVRMNPRDFTERPFVSADSNTFFLDRTLALGSVTLTKRNFLKSLRIRGFGKTEDIPVGGAISVVFGKEINEFVDRPYLELKGTWGRYFTKIGYINLSATTGSFFKNSVAEDGLVTVGSTYFSDLLKWRKMQVRQFIFFTYTKGLHRSLNQTISVEGKWEDNRALPPLGNERLTIGFETVYFMPWYVYGFQFALFHRFDLGLLLNHKPSPFDSPLSPVQTMTFPAIRGGARMLNENLVLPSFSVELAYFGKSQNFSPAWQFKFSTTLPDLFGTSQVFKPTVSRFE